MKRNTQSTLPNARSGLVLAVTAAVVFTLALSGCSKPADTSSPPKAAAPTTEAPAPGAPQAAAPQTAAPKPAAVPQAAAKPAAPQASATPAAGNDAAAMKRLIEEKMKQLQSGAAKPAAGQPNTPPAPAPSSPPAKPLAPPQAAPQQPAPPQAAPESAPPKPAAPDIEFSAGKTPILDGETLDMTPPPADQPQPKLVYDRELYVADPIWRGQRARFVFNVRNEGQGVLNMKMKSCCGLSINGVRTGWPGWSLKPGESEVFEMTLGPSVPGDFTRFSPLHTNDPNHPKVNFTCKGRVLVAFHLEPHAVNLGKVEPDSGPITRTITITRGDGGPLQPKVIPPKNPRVKAELHEVQPGERYTLDVTVTPPLSSGPVHGAVMVETGVSQAPVERILIVSEPDTEEAGHR
jgi:hypothetical protein